MFTKVAGSIGKGMLGVFNSENSESALVQMFRVEYGKEYRAARKFGAVINEQYVNQFLADQRTGT